MHYYCMNSYSKLYPKIGLILLDRMKKSDLIWVDIEYNMALFYCYKNNLEDLGEKIIKKII